MKKILIFILFSVLASACQNENGELRNYLKIVEFNSELKGKTIIVIMPLIGCHTCIEQTIDILNASENKQSVFLILSSFDKSLRQKYIERIDSRITYYADKKEELFDFKLFSKTDPALFFLIDGKIVHRIDYNVGLGRAFLMNQIDIFWKE